MTPCTECECIEFLTFCGKCNDKNCKCYNSNCKNDVSDNASTTAIISKSECNFSDNDECNLIKNDISLENDLKIEIVDIMVDEIENTYEILDESDDFEEVFYKKGWYDYVKTNATVVIIIIISGIVYYYYVYSKA